MSVYCHTYGWGIPAILTLISILNHNIQADELSSICLPGALQDDASLLYFIIIPEGVQLILSAFMFISGSVMAFCCGDARTSEKARGKLEAEALKRLKWPFFLYGILFLIAKVSFSKIILVKMIYHSKFFFLNFRSLYFTSGLMNTPIEKFGYKPVLTKILSNLMSHISG